MRLPVMPRRARSGVIEVRRGREKLPTRYSDDAVLKMATRDGQSGFNTNRWGPGNRQEYGLGVVRATAGTHGAAVRVALEEDLAKVAVAHVHEREKFGVCRATAYNALTPVARTATRPHLLMRKLAEHELGEPTSRWPVLVFLGLLILGDLPMTPTAMQVLNLSDRRFVSWLPFAEVHVAAVPVVVGMFGAAHWLGESLKAYRYEPQLRLARKIIAGLSATAALALALSVAAIRTSYLNANGVPAQSGAFVGIQLGLVAVATAASMWSAHPYASAWRQLEREERRADRHYGRARQRAGQQAAAVNGLAEEFRRRVEAARAGLEAVLSDITVRQGYLYRWALQHGQPEPTEEELFAGPLPELALPRSVQELLDYPSLPPGSSLTAPEPVDLHDLDEAWERLRQRRLSALWADGSSGVDGQEPVLRHPLALETTPAGAR